MRSKISLSMMIYYDLYDKLKYHICVIQKVSLYPVCKPIHTESRYFFITSSHKVGS